jgi:hypothetical protein
MIESAAPLWDHDFARRSPTFAALRSIAEKLPEIGWPNVEVLNHVALESGRRMVNARGQRIWFVPGEARDSAAQGFEMLTFMHGHVRVRAINWHDLLNALVWMTFPTAKASINARHQQALDIEQGGARSPVRDALTHFDEDGVVVLSVDTRLSDLLRAFAWRELFWSHRSDASRSMRFLPFGHALYDKLRAPFIGLTAKALIFEVEPAVLALDRESLRAQVDRLLGLHILDDARMSTPRVLQPLPVLGIPGWWPENETPDFYDNSEYFRPGRGG